MVLALDRRRLCALLLLAACGKEPGDGDAGTTDASTTAGDPSTAADPGTTAEPTTTTTDATTGEPLACDLEEWACTLAEAGGEFEDCGAVTPTDHDLAAWTAARECALTAAAEARAFKLLTWHQGIDSAVGTAWIGVVGDPYQVVALSYDSNICGGGDSDGCGATIGRVDCSGVSEIPSCTVDPTLGEACLACPDAGDSTMPCGPA